MLQSQSSPLPKVLTMIGGPANGRRADATDNVQKMNVWELDKSHPMQTEFFMHHEREWIPDLGYLIARYLRAQLASGEEIFRYEETIPMVVFDDPPWKLLLRGELKKFWQRIRAQWKMRPLVRNEKGELFVTSPPQRPQMDRTNTIRYRTAQPIRPPKIEVPDEVTNRERHPVK